MALPLQPLQKDSTLPRPSAMIVSASAGAGKTYTLAMRLVQLLLSPVIPRNGLKNILAITFTNVAAAEMRQRVLKFLKQIALDPSSAAARDAATIISGDPDALRRRAEEVLEGILAHYGDFQIRTIDSFMTRLFKASALEFGFQPEFDIVMEQQTLIAYAFDLYARTTARSPEGMRDLREVVALLTEQTGADKTFPWDPYSRMIAAVAALLQTLASKTGNVRERDTSGEMAEQAGHLRTLATAIEAAVRTAGLPMSKLFAADLAFALRGDWRGLLARKEKQSIVTKPANAQQKAVSAALEAELHTLLEGFNACRRQLAVLEARSYYRPFVVALAYVASTIEEAKRRKGTVAIDDVNSMLVEFLSSGSVPDVVVCLGERIAHYLIDEFQDTSPVQWAGLRPLIENALAEGGSLFAVGDTKQSIYGFRGADWRIMKGLLDGVERLGGSQLTPASLEKNYRSGSAIVEFTREVFQRQAPAAGYGDAAVLSGLLEYRQEPADDRRGKGHVEVLHLQKSPERSEAGALLELIADARRRGRRYGEIAILTPSNRTVLEISGWLNGAGIPFLSHSSLDIRTRKVSGEMLGLLSFLDSPVDDLAFATVVLGDVFGGVCAREFPELDCRAVREFILGARRNPSRPLYALFREKFPAVWERCFDRLFAQVGYFPLYDLVCEVYKTFDLLARVAPEQSGLMRLLEVVKDFEAAGSNSLKEFLAYADDDGDESPWAIERQQASEAVTVMTVHKAKGLQFPVVITLLYDGEKHPSSMVFRQDGESLELWHVTQQAAANAPELAELYGREALLSRADELNRLYVVLTRAQLELYAICVSDGDRKFPSCLLPVQPGPSARPVPEAIDADALPPGIRPRPHTLRLPIKPGVDRRIGFFETRRGDYFHDALARLDFLEEDTAAVVDGLLAGPPPEGIESREVLRQKLLSFLIQEDVRPFFTRREGRTVRTEQEFLSRSGALYRVDRLVIDPERVTVLDFKTGGDADEQAYREQIQNYMAILRDVFPDRAVCGAIAYIDRLRVVEVGTEKEASA